MTSSPRHHTPHHHRYHLIACWHSLAPLVVFPFCILTLQSRWTRPGGASTPLLAAGIGNVASFETGPAANLAAQQRCRAPLPTESVPQLELIGSWKARRHIPKQQVTIVTIANIDRIDRVERQCRAWPFALAVAIYVPQLVDDSGALERSRTNIAEARQLLSQLHGRMQNEGACALKLRLYTERCNNETIHLFPNNSLRNRALQMAETEAVIPLDIDFLVSQHFTRELGTRQGWAAVQRLLHQNGTSRAVVMPAFTPRLVALRYRGEVTLQELEWGTALAAKAAQAGKEFVLANYHNGSLAQVDENTIARRNTNITRWFNAQAAYSVEYSRGYEPDIIILRRYMPWYDERFRGYAMNKAVVYVAMWHMGIKLIVHPSAYVVHVPHPWSDTRQVSQTTQHFGRMKDLFAGIFLTLVHTRSQFYPVTTAIQCLPLIPVV